MSVIEPVPPKRPTPRAATLVDDDDDLDIVAHEGVQFEAEDQIVPEVCPSCARPTMRHSPAQAWDCMEALEARTAEWRAREAEQEAATESAPVVDDDDDEYEYDDDDDVIATTTPTETAEERAERERLFPVDGAPVDYEELARAMRTVIERERDEMVKRGGPIEKQNAELKERLAKQYEETALFRRRHQQKCEEYNLLKEQNEQLTRTNRKLKAELSGRKVSGEHVRILELTEILKVVERAGPDWQVLRSGNGHYQVKHKGVFVTDLASSGQGNKVNMASRNALKKMGLRV